MVRLIARKEILEHLLTLRFTLSLVICAVLAVMGTATLRMEYEKRIADYSQGLNTSTARVLAMTMPEQLRNEGTIVYRKPEVLSIFSRGFTGAVADNILISQLAMTSQSSLQSENPVRRLFGRFDLSSIFSIIFSFLVLLLAHDAISGEKQHGTLKLMLSNAIPRDSILLGKYIGGMISIGVPFGTSVLLALLLMVHSPAISFQMDDWIRIVLIGFICVLYLSLFYLVGLMVSSRTHTPFQSLMVLLLVWISLNWMVPKATSYAVYQITSIPSVEKMEENKLEAIVETVIQKWKKAIREIAGIDMGSRDLQRATPEEWQLIQETFSKQGLDLKEFENQAFREAVEEVSREWTESYYAKIGHQITLTHMLNRVSPASLFFDASCALARTDWQSQKRFLTAVSRYRDHWSLYADERVAERNKRLQQGGQWDPTTGELRGFDFKRGLPVFTYTLPTVKESLSDLWVDLLGMGILNLLSCIGAYVSFMKYEP